MTELGTLDLVWSDDSAFPIRLRTRLIHGGGEGCWVNFTCEQAIDIATQLLLSVRETKAARGAGPVSAPRSLAAPGKPERSRRRLRVIEAPAPPSAARR